MSIVGTLLSPKDPAEILDYGRDWTPELTADGEASISTSAWSVSSPAGLTIATSPAPSINGLITTLWVSGGTNGTKYSLVNTIVTPAGRKYERTIVVPCRER
jgi:hypothetical protein